MWVTGEVRPHALGTKAQLGVANIADELLGMAAVVTSLARVGNRAVPLLRGFQETCVKGQHRLCLLTSFIRHYQRNRTSGDEVGAEFVLLLATVDYLGAEGVLAIVQRDNSLEEAVDEPTVNVSLQEHRVLIWPKDDRDAAPLSARFVGLIGCGALGQAVSMRAAIRDQGVIDEKLHTEQHVEERSIADGGNIGNSQTPCVLDMQRGVVQVSHTVNLIFS